MSKATEHELFPNTVSRAFSDGDFANAYETNDYPDALERLESTLAALPEALRVAYRDAFAVGFFGSYELHEMGEHEESYREAYASVAGQECVKAGYTDERAPEEFDR